MNKYINKIVTIFLLLVVATTLKINAQNNSCATPYVLDTAHTKWDLTITGTELWVQFTAKAMSARIGIDSTNFALPENVDSFYVYKGSCSNYTLIKQSNFNTDSLRIYVDSLIINSQYLIKICRRPATVNCRIRLYIEPYINNYNDYWNPYVSSNCERIYDPYFETFNPTCFGFSNFPFFVNDNLTNCIGGWAPLTGSPQIIDITIPNDDPNHCARLVTRGDNKTEGILTKISLIEGNNYKLSFKYRITKSPQCNYTNLEYINVDLVSVNYDWTKTQTAVIGMTNTEGPNVLLNDYLNNKISLKLPNELKNIGVLNNFSEYIHEFKFIKIAFPELIALQKELEEFKLIAIYPKHFTGEAMNLFDLQIDDVQLLPNEKVTITGEETLCIGTSTTLNATLSGNYTNKTFQWKKNGNIIAGATNQTYNTAVQNTASSNIYSCIVTYGNGCIASANLTVTHIEPPVVNVTPSTLESCSNNAGYLTATILSNIACDIEWKYQTSTLQTTNNSTTSTYTPQQSGIYYAKAILGSCFRYSNTANVIVNKSHKPIIIAEGGTNILEHCNIILKITNPIAGLTYQWYKNNQIIAGATNSSYETSSADNYYLKVTTSHNCTEESNHIDITESGIPALEITGNEYACGLETYTIHNFADFTSNNITLLYCIDGTNFIPITSSTFDIQWYGTGAVIQFIAVTACGDSVSLSPFEVSSCCDNIIFDYYLNNTEITTLTQFDEKNVFISGTIIVKSNLEFANGNFVFDANAKIIIQNNGLLLLSHKAKLLSCSSSMWDGIIVDEGGDLQVTGDNNEIRDAKTAITVLRNHKNFDIGSGEIRYCNLKNNYRNIVVYEWKSGDNIHGLDVGYNDQIELKSPYNGYNTYSGIEFYGCNNVNLPITNTYKKNNFENINYGIILNNSSVTIDNCTFKNMYYKVPDLAYVNAMPATRYDGTGIFVVGKSLLGEEINIIKNQDYQYINRFYNCNYGISIFDIRDAKFRIEDCYFSNINKSAINIENTISTYDIRNNYIELSPFEFANGININYNLLPEGGSETTGYDANIENNTIYYARSGIEATLSSKLNVHNNHVYFPLDIDFSRFYYGVRVNECQSANIENNYIQSYVTARDEMEADQMQGINVTLSPFSRIADNQLITTGSGLYIAGDNRRLTIQCNEMNGNFNGVRLSRAFIGNQGTEEEAWNNSWLHINSIYFISGSIGEQINWYSVNSGDYSLLQNRIENSLTITAVEVSNGIPCSSESSQSAPDSVLVSNPEERSELLGEVVNTSVPANVSTYSDESEYFKVKHTFDAIDKDTTILDMNVPEDANYIDFYNQTKATNIGKFKNVEKLVKAESVEEAKALNLSVTAESNIDINSKIVNDIYLRTWAVDTISISAEDSITLYGIASQNPLSGGEAVYKARMMLNINFDDWIDDGTASFRQANTQPVIPAITTYVYNNWFNVKINLMNRTVGYVEIYSLSGTCLYKSEVSEGINSISLDKNSYAESVYFIKLLDANGNIIAVNKWVNIK